MNRISTADELTGARPTASPPTPSRWEGLVRRDARRSGTSSSSGATTTSTSG